MFNSKYIIIPLTYFLIFFSNSAFCDLSDGLVAYYPFSGNANDESGNGHDGVVNGATLTYDRFGVANRAYSFDGSTNFIQVPSSSSLQIQDAITLSAWVFHHSNSTPQHIVNTSTLRSGYRLAAWWANPAGNALEFYDDNGDQHLVDDGEQPYIGVWTHIAGTWDGSVMRIYRDGVLAGETPFTGQISIANDDLYIGVLNPIPWPIQGYFHGYIDEVRIYNRALSVEEVNQLMAVDVEIDIKPGNGNNVINPNRRGDLKVAILTSGEFDALRVNPETVIFGPGEATTSGIKVKDVDHDGDNDLLLYFSNVDTGISCGDTKATLYGSTYDSISIIGTDTIIIKGCN